MRLIKKTQIPVQIIYKSDPPIGLDARLSVDPSSDRKISFDFSISGLFDDKEFDYFNVNELIFQNFSSIIAGIGIFCVESNLTSEDFDQSQMTFNQFVINFIMSQNEDFYFLDGNTSNLVKLKFSKIVERLIS